MIRLLLPAPPASPEELCAAYLADPWRVPLVELPWSSCNVQRLLDILRKNKVPLVSLPDLAGSQRIRGDPLFEAAREAEVSELVGLRAEYELVRETLAAHGIAGILIKSVGLKPSFPFKSDNLDVLYKPHDVAQVRATLSRLGYVELTNVEEPHKYLFRRFHGGRSVSAIHVHEHVGWMTSFLDEERIWQRCRPTADDDKVTIQAPEDALLTTLAHWFYEDKRLSLQDMVRCSHCLRQGVDWDELYRIASWRGWCDGLSVSLLLYSYQESALYGPCLVEGDGRYCVSPTADDRTLVPPSVLERAWRGVPGWTRMLLERRGGVAARGASMPLPIPFLFSKAFFYAKLARDPSRGAMRKAKDLVVHTTYGTKLRLHVHSQPAMLVTFSGVDGCGKTTQARALQSAFETCHLRVDYVWSRAGSAKWVAFLTRWMKGLAGSIDIAPAASPQAAMEDRIDARQQQLRAPWKRWGWSWLTTIELLLQYTGRVTWPLLRGHVVICDRYVYDTLADWSAYFGEEAVQALTPARVLQLLTPRPRLAYWLDVPAHVAQSRSSDGFPLAFLVSQSNAYRRLADTQALRRLDGTGLAAGDGNHGWEGINDRVVCDVLGTYFAGYHTLVNDLFLKNPGQWR